MQSFQDYESGFFGGATDINDHLKAISEELEPSSEKSTINDVPMSTSRETGYQSISPRRLQNIVRTNSHGSSSILWSDGEILPKNSGSGLEST